MNAPPPRETPDLHTSRLHLRPRTVADAEALHPTFTDPELMHWWSSGPHVSIEETRASFATIASNWRCWAITLAGNASAIGYVSAGERRQRNVSEIGFVLARKYWGTGIAQEAVGSVIDQVFTEGQRRVFADTDPENIPSRTMLERLGFRLEGLLRAEWETHIGIRDTALYGLLREEWQCRSDFEVPA